MGVDGERVKKAWRKAVGRRCGPNSMSEKAKRTGPRVGMVEPHIICINERYVSIYYLARCTTPRSLHDA